MIDEADIYKNLEYYTQLTYVRGLGSALGSDRAFDMMLKVRYVQSIDGGVVFATGTPISNTLVATPCCSCSLKCSKQMGLKRSTEATVCGVCHANGA